MTADPDAPSFPTGPAEYDRWFRAKVQEAYFARRRARTLRQIARDKNIS